MMRKSKDSKWFYILIIICFLSLNVSVSVAQMVNSQSDVNIIKKGVVDFLISQGDLEKGGELEDYDKRMHMEELLDETVLGYKRSGIYRVRVFTSHTKQYVLIKNNLEYDILDTDNLGVALKSVADFLAARELSNDKILAYMKAVIEIYEINEKRNPVGLKK